MDAIPLISIGLIYFLLQYAGIRYLSGGWQHAAVLAAPLLATMIAFGIVGIQLNIPGSGMAMTFALPIGIAYLLCIMALRVLAQIVQQQQKS